MYQENDSHKQSTFFSLKSFLTPKLWEQLSNSWAGTFYNEVFCKIDEKIFAPLYSEKYSRPNAPINVLVALEILKSGFGWCDEELHRLRARCLRLFTRPEPESPSRCICAGLVL